MGAPHGPLGDRANGRQRRDAPGSRHSEPGRAPCALAQHPPRVGVPVTPASRLLTLARAATPDRPTGVARSGACVVTYERTLGHAYEVGTDAVSIIGPARSSVVLPYISAILAGNVTRATCDAWISAAPARANAAAATGARLPAGTTRVSL